MDSRDSISVLEFWLKSYLEEAIADADEPGLDKKELGYRSHHVLGGAEARSRIKVDLSVILVQVARVPI